MTLEMFAWLWIALVLGFIVVSIVRFGFTHRYWEHDGGTLTLLVGIVILGSLTGIAAVVAGSSLGIEGGWLVVIVMLGYLVALAASGLLAEYAKLMRARSKLDSGVAE